jgi:hypothetical protein
MTTENAIDFARKKESELIEKLEEAYVLSFQG